jgi:tRNA-splicing ligase RtcB (3'-phosphate/5'-hydroxy nucleic acid ligase)
MINGNTLLELGFKSGKWFGDAIKFVNENNLQGQELTDYLNTVCPSPFIEPLFIEPFEKPINYIKNIIAETEDEILNISKVFSTMDLLMKTPTIVNGCVMPDACPTGEI